MLVKHTLAGCTAGTNKGDVIRFQKGLKLSVFAKGSVDDRKDDIDFMENLQQLFCCKFLGC